ncbi:MAG TPA: hypothetical protein VHE30_13965 [Polyangiaceae bacterium]|nr:hypothetical protein [Polyangiaceae bacterium]
MSQSKSRSLPTAVLLSAVLGGGALGVLSPRIALALEGPCKSTNFNFPAVKAACASPGGRKAAQGVMKKAVDAAKSAGKGYKCQDCHDKEFNVKSDAPKDEIKDLKSFM